MPIKETLRLSVGEGLFGAMDTMASTPGTFQTLGGDGGNHPSSTLYFSRDMVAIDSVMYDDMLAEKAAHGSPANNPNKGYLEFASDADHALGTYEDIDFIDV